MAAHEWWEMVAGGAGELRKIAMRVLSKTSSASACERNWSAFSAVQSPRRNRLSSKTLNDLVYLRVNWRLQQRRVDSNFANTVAEWVETTAVDDDIELDDEEAQEPTVSVTDDAGDDVGIAQGAADVLAIEVA